MSASRTLSVVQTNPMCSSIIEKSLQSEYLDRKGDNDNRNFLGRYIHVLIYSSCSLGAIEPNMANIFMNSCQF